MSDLLQPMLKSPIILAFSSISFEGFWNYPRSGESYWIKGFSSVTVWECASWRRMRRRWRKSRRRRGRCNIFVNISSLWWCRLWKLASLGRAWEHNYNYHLTDFHRYNNNRSQQNYSNSLISSRKQRKFEFRFLLWNAGIYISTSTNPNTTPSS